MINKERVANILGISIDDLNKIINEKTKQYNNLIDEKTALLLILKENNIDPEKLENIKIKDLRYKMKIDKIYLYINRILLKKDNLIILEVLDDTGKIKLIIKDYNYKNREDLLKEGNYIIIKNGLVLKNRTLAIFINNVNNILQLKDENFINLINNLNKNEVYYISEFEGKVLGSDNEKYEILTEKFSIIYLISKEKLDINKNYDFIVYLKKPLECIYCKEINKNQ